MVSDKYSGATEIFSFSKKELNHCFILGSFAEGVNAEVFFSYF
jgi:hypothetical protein